MDLSGGGANCIERTLLFFFFLTILAFSLCKTMAAHYKTVSCLPSRENASVCLLLYHLSFPSAQSSK